MWAFYWSHIFFWKLLFLSLANSSFSTASLTATTFFFRTFFTPLLQALSCKLFSNMLINYFNHLCLTTLAAEKHRPCSAQSEEVLSAAAKDTHGLLVCHDFPEFHYSSFSQIVAPPTCINLPPSHQFCEQLKTFLTEKKKILKYWLPLYMQPWSPSSHTL